MLAATKLNPNLWWYLARAGGLVAWALLAASVFWGLWYAGRLSRRVPPRAWTLDLHRFLGGLALIFVVIHVAALTADKFVDFGALQVLVPFASHWRPGAVAWGITAMYLLVAVELTSLVMHLMPKKVWHSIHLLSFVLFAFATVHAIQTGTDMRNPLVRAFGILLLISAVVVAVLRVGHGWQRAQGSVASRTAAARPAAPAWRAASPHASPAWSAATKDPPAIVEWPSTSRVTPTEPGWSPPREYAAATATTATTTRLVAPSLVTRPSGGGDTRTITAPTSSQDWARCAAAAAPHAWRAEGIRNRRPNTEDGPTRQARER